ncbi:hypothetical protein F5Y14DRAFT_425072 [Nemania sp. NC0429]|nr:hypothetical protein F5Y14DRAFT_425072 [Nemania sp. NC0429]
MMNTVDQVIYAGCWVVLLLYISTTLVAFTRGSCVACAASFFFACALWLYLCMFNAWFFLPAFIYHVPEINLHADNFGVFLRAVFTSEAAVDVYLMSLGSFGSWLAVFNAMSMLSPENRVVLDTQGHGRITRYFLKSAYRLRDYLDLGGADSEVTLPIAREAHVHNKEKSGSLAIV